MRITSLGKRNFSRNTDNDATYFVNNRIGYGMRRLASLRFFVFGLIPLVLLQGVSVYISSDHYTDKNSRSIDGLDYSFSGFNRWLMTTKVQLPDVFEENLADLDDPMPVLPKEGGDTPFYWHVLKSGGTTVKNWYSECYQLIEACEIGALEGHGEENSLQIVEINEGQHHVNVDTTVLPGIERAAELQLIPSRVADIVFSPLLHESLDLLFSSEHRGRMFAMIRHPVDRVVSLFYYLQNADWEPTYNPAFKDMTIEEYANSTYVEANWMVRSLVNEWEGPITIDMFGQAKEILRRKCLVGLISKFDESLHRFNRYFGFKLHIEGGDLQDVDEQEATQDQYFSCMEKYHQKRGSNVHAHPRLSKESDTYALLKEKNGWDMELYNYIGKELFKEQGKIIDQVLNTRAEYKRKEEMKESSNEKEKPSDEENELVTKENELVTKEKI